MYWLAFYKANSTWRDRLISKVSRSPYAHVELLKEKPPAFGRVYGFSSSNRDDGVRQKLIWFMPDRWDFVPVNWGPPDAAQKIISEIGKPYDYRGLFFTQLFNLRLEAREKWFCSEICAWALGLDGAASYSPGDLKRTVEEHNRTYHLGRQHLEGTRS